MAFLNQITPEEIEERASELVLHSRINYAFRRLNEYLENDKTWGMMHLRKFEPQAGLSISR